LHSISFAKIMQNQPVEFINLNINWLCWFWFEINTSDS